MTPMPRPTLDARTPADIAAAVWRHLGWPHEHEDSLCSALIAVLAQYGGELSQRLDMAPQRQLDAFADLLRPTRFDAVPAHTVLAFKPVARPRGMAATAMAPVVPAGTQVAGPTPPGAREPLIFETQAALVLSQAQVVRAFAADAGPATWAEATAIAGPAGLVDPPLEHAQPVARGLFIGLPDAAVVEAPGELHVRVTMTGATAWPDTATVVWGLRTPDGEVPVMPESDGTAGLSHGGELVLRDVPPWPATVLGGRAAHWLVCRVIDQDATGTQLPLRTSFGGRIDRIDAVVRRALPAQAPGAAFFGSLPLDASRDFFPFGERPRFGDVFLAQSPLFALPGAQVVLDVKLTNAADAPGTTPLPRVAADHPVSLQWDVWTARGWIAVVPGRDETLGFKRSARLRFLLPPDVAPTTLHGSKGGFLRARIAGGDYLVAETRTGATQDPPMAAPPVHRPPAVARLMIEAAQETSPLDVTAIAVERGLETTVFDAPATGVPAAPVDTGEPAALYLGLRCDAREDGGPEPLHVVLQRDSAGARRAAASGSQTQPPPLRWQYRDAGGWADLSLKALPSAEAGQEAVVVSIPANWQSWQGSSVDPTLCWLRLLDADDPAVTPSLSRVMLNAVPAMQQVTMTDDELGSSSGAPNQVFTLARPGVLGEPVLEVCELGVLAPADRAALIEAQGVDAVRTIESFGRLPARTWTRWRRVDDFAASGALSRDFVLDAHEGRVCFGDGRHGRIPPIGANNIVMRRYCCGGGAAGNVAANSIAQLRSTLPYVASVAQPVAATGGTDAESPAASRASATSWLRHRDRAVGPDDYEDLACRAASDVARAKCLPVRDVGADPLARTLAPGCLSLALLPRDAHAPAPQPTADLYARVRAFLRERSASGVRLQLCAPLYVRIDVDAEVVALPSADALALAQTCEERLAEFLHPVRGGPHGEGWEFGRWPHVSELRGALKGVAGLGEVRQLRQRHPQDPPGAATAPHALVCAGRLTMKAVA